MKFTSKIYDLCVVGGGFAGFGAAVRAARLGLRTLLVEKGPLWGGAAREGMHESVCGLYLSGGESAGRTLNDGLPREIEQALLARGHAGIAKTGKVFTLDYQPEKVQALFNELAGGEENLEVLFNAAVDRVETGDKLIERLRVRYPGDTFWVEAGAAVDCSGGGDLILMSGTSYEISSAEKRQLAAYAFRIEGTRAGDLQNLHAAYYWAQAAEKETIAPYLRFSVWTPSQSGDSGIVKMSVLPSDAAYDMDEIRQQAHQLHAVLKKTMPAFKNSMVTDMAFLVAEREGLRMNGLYTLTEEDVLSARKFEDGVVKSAWPIEFWDPQKGPRYRYLDDGQYYEIPGRCLRSKDLVNLFAGGRCLSASPQALASARMTGTCLALGEQSAQAAFHYLTGQGEKVCKPVADCASETSGK